MRVHVQHEPEAATKQALLAALDPSIATSFGAAPDADIDILVSGRPDRGVLEAAAGLRALVIPFAGVPKATMELMADFPDVAVYNLHHNAPATAEMAVALLLAAAKSLPRVDRAFRAGDWSDRGRMETGVQLEGRQALVLGAGAIGTRVARACAGLGMTVTLVARHARQGVHGVAELAALLPVADALVVCLPATSATEGLIGERQIALLPREAVIVNIARGPIIDERALFEALRERRLFAAGLDVWWTYPDSQQPAPRPSALPFHELDNVVMSPHRGGHVSDTEPRRMQALAGLLNAAAAGQPMPNRVDLAAGY